ncbi:sn-glycerol-1-phosphate dehydrogenase [Aeoliella sp.]|uniref:sn-glycerol-1-phosphate dehydrogenase n=1 Tax=Aeoliella sp. TaxID=2795800 RepID=UPI003CCBE5C3
MTDDRTDQLLVAKALQSARDTKHLALGSGALRELGSVFRSLFPKQAAIVICDANTHAAAGEQAESLLSQSGIPITTHVFPADGLYAESSYVNQAQKCIEASGAIPVAVGAGTINDIVKLASHRASCRYLCVSTAASMDGYTAYGASISHRGSKQTFDCPAPLGVVADIDIIAAAPPWLNASGYADLFAKCPAGADWLLAAAVEVDPVDISVWAMVQDRLRQWLSDPQGVSRSEPETIRRLTTALMMTGFAMQTALTSRPASGAEHQFSHLWDMEKHVHHDSTPSHGFKVGIGSLASIRLYDALLSRPLDQVDVEKAISKWPDWNAEERTIRSLFTDEALVGKAMEESSAKHATPASLKSELRKLSAVWEPLRSRLTQQLYPYEEARDMLSAAGCPTDSEQIGISAERLCASHLKAYYIRRRYTVLDLVRRAGLWNALVGSDGPSLG